MNRHPLPRRLRRPARRTTSSRTADRRGSVLLVVIGLLGLLLLVGFTYFTFAAQEDNAAQYYSEGSKVETDAMSVDVLWDWALRQIILGAPQGVTISPLWAPPNSNSPPQLPGNGTPPGRHSLVGSLLGIDFSIYNGQGVNVIQNIDGFPQVDQNFDGVADNNSLLMLNYSAAAQTNGVAPTVPFFPSSDVDYTYPDFNNIFLAYKGETMDSAGNVYKVIIPSYHRPQLLRNIGAGWQTSAATGAAAAPGPATSGMKILRPHPTHVIPGTGGSVKRFINTGETVNNVLGQPIAQFPFIVDNNGDSTPGEMGIFSNTVGGAAGALRLDYDKDNDGDGIKEGILLDLGFPAQDLPDGRKYVPIFSVTIYDADALINLNTAGNLSGLVQLNSPMTQPFGQTTTVVRPLSRSNQGLSSPSEINPWWALDANPSSDLVGDANSTFEQYRKFFGQNPGSQAEMANMDLFYHLIGRPEYTTGSTPSRYLAGRWGELNRLGQFVSSKNTNSLPWPGYSGSDDDNDRNEGEYGYATPAGVGSTLNGIIPPFGQPLDYRGAGTFFDLAGGPGLRPRLVGYSSLPGQWLQYIDFQSRGSNAPNNEIYGTAYYATTNLGVNQLMQQMNGNLTSPGGAVSGGTDYLVDHPSETIVDPRYTRLQNSVESIYDASEMQIHRSPNDADYASISSRLRNLMPFNFDSSARASEIRQRFTTISWDRSNPGFGAGNTNRAWEWNADINGNTTGGGININYPGSEFPPVFGSLTGKGAGTPNMQEPFRRELRRLLEMEQGAQLSGKKQLRLNINKLLTSNDNQAAPGSQVPNYSNLLLKYRDLTPHSTGLTANPVPTSPSTSQPAVGMSAADQEFWARKDRQQMARDIYVMLYTLGGGQDGVNYATTANTVTAVGPPVQRQLYNDQQLREMAQFAVNLVDALDRDNVITKFEYPKDLSQGWTVNSTPLDDNPFTNEDTPLSPSNPQYDSQYPEDGLYRGVVYGVEAAQLTISEVMPLMCRNILGPTAMPQDHQGTEYDETKNKLPTDTNGGRYFMYVELRNASQFPVMVNNGDWQIRLSYYPRGPGGTAQQQKTLTIRDTINSQVGGGGLYLVGATDTDNIDPMDMKQRPSTVRLNPNWKTMGSIFNQYVPNPGYLPNLDISVANTNLYSLADVSTTQLPPTTPNVTGSNPTPIDWHDWFTNADPDKAMTVTLCRRLHPGRNTIFAYNQQQEYDNPWVTVDVQTVGGTPPGMAGIRTIPYFDAGDPDATTNGVFLAAMNQMRGLERPQPLDAYSATWNGSAPYNTLGRLNYHTTTLGGSFTLWQPHFDRDFASIAELFSIPLYGPDQLTRKFAINGKPAFDTYQSTPIVPDIDTPFRIAQTKILQPQHPNNVGGMGGGTTQLDNRWYRLFELIEVPSRMHQNAQITKDINATSPSPRVPGKININTIRTPSVLYALLDDPYLFNLSGMPTQPATDSHDTARNWWYQLLQSRDGLTSVNSINVPLPGMPPIFNGTVLTRKSQPFRGFGFMGTGPVGGTVNGPAQSIEHTLFRSLLLDGTNDTVVGRARRRLFEVGNQTEHNNATVDPYTRHRLLSKIIGNTTTRSNVFLVWISVDFFEAVEVPYGSDQVIRVGGPLNPPLPGHRMFGVIDRSIAEQTYRSGTGFNYKQMVLFQKTIE